MNNYDPGEKINIRNKYRLGGGGGGGCGVVVLLSANEPPLRNSEKLR